MKEKGFTLIELLAVIVILAIIALIATPIILNIINDTKEQSNKRSVELYANSIKNAAAAEQLKGNIVTSIDDIDMSKYYDGNVVCTTVNITERGKVTLAGCTVNGSTSTYKYGTNGVEKEEAQTPEEPTPDPEPEDPEPEPEDTYAYMWYDGEDVSGPSIGEDASSLSTSAPTDKDYYLKFKLDSENKVEESYACAVFNVKEKCVKGGSADFYGYAENEADYTGNILILKGLEAEGISCHFSSSARYSDCNDGSVSLGAMSGGSVSNGGDDGNCGVDGHGGSVCVSS